MAPCLYLPSTHSVLLPAKALRSCSTRYTHHHIEHLRLRPFTCCFPQGSTSLKSTVCFASLAALALTGAKQAFSLQDVGEASTGLSATPEVMYAIFAIEAVALIGAAVGGILARQRKEELERLNAQLRKINGYLRSKTRTETDAPGLVDVLVVGRPVDDEVLSTERKMIKRLLKSGKMFLREKKPQLAYEEFKKALPLAQQISDPIQEKKAAKGLGASCQRQGKFREAIGYHAMLLEISERTGATEGNTEALGSIADCYCELGELDAAQNYYNQYIDLLTTDEGGF